MRSILYALPNKLIVPLFLLGGMLAGLGGYTIHVSRAFSYLSDDPASCVNCHIMTPYYQSWSRSSHMLHASCNDCHIPHENIVKAYSFKAMDGLYHSAVFTLNAEPQVIRPRSASYSVIMNNCIRCHKQLNTEFVKTGMASYEDVLEGKSRACWDCHTQVPHTKVSNLAASPHAVAPLPTSPVPGWLQNLTQKGE